MSSTVLFFFVVCDTTNFIYAQWVTDGPSYTVDYVAVPGLKGSYKFYKSQGSWDDAKDTCDSDDADLYFPQNKIELGKLVKYWKSQNVVVPSAFLVGMERSGDGFRTVDDEPLSEVFHCWRLGEPNNDNGDEDCGSIHYNANQWQLNDIPCYIKMDMPFICKSPIDPKYDDDVITENVSHTTNVSRTVANDTKLIDYKSYFIVPGLNDTYKLYRTASTWAIAQSTCDNDGATLYYPKNETELNALIKFWKAKEDYFPIQLHVGMVDSGSGYKTVDDQPISSVYNLWSHEKKSVSDNTTCAAIFNDTTRNSWVLDDVKCNDGVQLPFMCKSPLSADLKCKSTTYLYTEQLGKCYKFHVTPKTWSEARNICRAEHSDLAVINSHEEAAHLVRLSSVIHRSRIPGTFTHGIVLLGFRNEGDDWQTVDGTSLYDSGYACWGNSQPDNEEHDKCGSMFYNGHLNDIGCDEKAFFICEHDTPNYVYEAPIAEQSLQCFDDVVMNKKFLKRH